MYQIMLPGIRSMGGFNDFKNGSFRVWDEINDMLDCSTCDYRASSWLIDPTDSPEVALKVSGEILSLLLGYLALRGHNNIFQHVRVNEIQVFDGNFSASYASFDEIEIPNYYLQDVWVERLKFKPHDPREINNLSNRGFDTLLYLASSNMDIYILLKLLSVKTSWFTLYKIYESLETFVTQVIDEYPHLKTVENNGVVRKVLDFKSQTEKLTKPANNFSIVGLNSRHGYVSSNRTINTANCFTLSEAKAFVLEHVRKYISWKIDKFHESDLFQTN